MIQQKTTPLILFFLSLLLTFSSTNAQESHTCKHHKHQFSWNHNGIADTRSATASISDSIDLIKHTIHLDLTAFPEPQKYTACTIDFAAVVDTITVIPLDLKDQTIDSVVHSSGLLDYDYDGESLEVVLADTLLAGMSDQITIYYSGSAVLDPSGFGGFYFNTNIAYNIGVAFTDWPPSYGRAWFPCFDNFVEKSMYEFQVLTTGGLSAYCNGYLQSTDTLSGDTVSTTWIMDEEISSYLASVAVSDFERTEWEFESITGDTIPVFLVGPAGNLENMENTFSNLETVFHAFEEWFGPYRWPKVGYTLTPVGAMEHSTNIAYPPSLLGSGAAESVMAHELAHEWFGNLVTCDAPSDMWLNEGWAEFLSILAYEAISGPEEYAERMRDKHRDVLHKAHFLDGDFLTMSAIPPEMTYGEHVYNKGALMAHSLRGYLGDDLFFAAMTDYLNTFEFENAASEDLRDFLNTYPGVDVTEFFDDWIGQPGWAQFSVDDLTAEPTEEGFSIDLEIRQRLRGALEYFQDVPITLSLMDENWNVYETQIVASGPLTDILLDAPFEPVFATLNRDEKLAYAVTAEERIIASDGAEFFNHALATVFIGEVTEPIALRVEHNWAGPGGSIEPDGYTLSPDRYWRVGGNFDDDFVADIRFQFDARNTASGNIDVDLFDDIGDVFNELQLVMLYRSTPSGPWEVWEDFTIQTLGSPSNGYAQLFAHNITHGEYAFGYTEADVGISEKEQAFIIFPNPAKNEVTISANGLQPLPATLTITDMDGKIVLEQSISGGLEHVDVSKFSRGTYVVQIHYAGSTPIRQQLILQ